MPVLQQGLPGAVVLDCCFPGVQRVDEGQWGVELLLREGVGAGETLHANQLFCRALIDTVHSGDLVGLEDARCSVLCADHAQPLEGEDVEVSTEFAALLALVSRELVRNVVQGLGAVCLREEDGADEGEDGREAVD